MEQVLRVLARSSTPQVNTKKEANRMRNFYFYCLVLVCSRCHKFTALVLLWTIKRKKRYKGKQRKGDLVTMEAASILTWLLIGFNTSPPHTAHLFPLQHSSEAFVSFYIHLYWSFLSAGIYCSTSFYQSQKSRPQVDTLSLKSQVLVSHFLWPFSIIVYGSRITAQFLLSALESRSHTWSWELPHSVTLCDKRRHANLHGKFWQLHSTICVSHTVCLWTIWVLTAKIDINITIVPEQQAMWNYLI